MLISKSKIKDFSLMAGLSFLQAFMVSYNYRAIAAINYKHVLGSDILFYLLNFSVLKHVAKAETKLEMVGYVVGGCIGSLLAVFLASHL